MTNEVAEKIVRGIEDKIECNTVDIDDWAEFWGFTREEYEEFLDVAIKALEQEPNGDCISRKAIKDMLTAEWTKYMPMESDVNLSFVLEKISELPSVTPKARWIPCSERLPKENEYIGNVCKYYLVQDEYGDMHVAHLSNVGWIPMHSLKAIGDEVIAYMPLPQPYKAECKIKQALAEADQDTMMPAT